MSTILSMVEGDFGQACLLDKRRKSRAHAHAEAHILLHVDGAEQEYRVDEKAVRLSRDQAVLINPQILHGNSVLDEGPSILLVLYLDLEWLLRRQASRWQTDGLFVHPAFRVDTQMRRRIDAIALSMQAGEGGGVEGIDQYCRELVDTILAAQRRPAALRFSRSSDFRIRRAISLMNDSLEEPMTVEQLARRVGLSRARFFDLFRACTGMSPAHYYKMLRLDLARHRLTSRSFESIAAVSRECGFGAQSHFSNFFTEKLGITPSEFRRASRSSRMFETLP